MGSSHLKYRTAAPARTALINRTQVLTVTLAESEAGQDPGYDVATPRVAAIHLSDGRRVVGTVRVYEPEGRDRLSDWARNNPDQFRYVDSEQLSLIVNMAHVVKVSEVEPGK